ncbi:hypothetical protein EC973_002408 [Apophysomyces ossiformis]|uniref:SWIM-type domain-containing protein n=1 Tax=Apophysomyces ossiformis TaxID=679940 RepID=A0A8H7EMK2_9FUNG|nr:hypothetical protein EC973_002408 [Apophysomyces ossiformis]
MFHVARLDGQHSQESECWQHISQSPNPYKNGCILEVFKGYWAPDDKVESWFAVFQPQVFTNMETNNYVESWHNQLKTTYLKRKHNRRVDRLLYILVHDVEFDYKINTARVTPNIGPEAALNDMVSGYAVRSFTQEDTVYNINVQDSKMFACTLGHFCWHRVACKHMFLLHRANPNLQIPQVSSYPVSAPTVPRIRQEQVGNNDTLNLVLQKNMLKEKMRNFLQEFDSSEVESIKTLLAMEQHFRKLIDAWRRRVVDPNMNLSTRS